MKLALGTVQFGLDYGVTNQFGRVSSGEVKKILEYGSLQKINMLDTAPAYGKSEKVLGQNQLNKFIINTKTSFINGETIRNGDIEGIERRLETSLVELGVESVNGLLVHNAKDLYKVGHDKLYEKLLELKGKGIVKKIGVSIYNLFEIEDLFNKYSFDIIQLPLNVLDQRLNDGSTFKELKRNNVEIHARSVFLQGILLSEAMSLPKQFRKAYPILEEYYSNLNKLGMSRLEGALKYIHQIEEIDYAIVGINSLLQLQQINDAYKRVKENKVKIDYAQYAIGDTQIIDPRMW